MERPQIVTRFAPSPTGFLHIGGARTALYNYYFARRHNGKFLIRIEDTDLKRSTEEAKQAIIDGLDWLGLSYDGAIVYQSKAVQRHKDIALKLLESGAAYKCYLSQEEQEKEREKSRAEGRAFRSPYRDLNKISSFDEDTPYVVRFRVPEGKTEVVDKVMGRIAWDNKDFDDLILLRADGTPVYMLAVVVDDHDMGVTHIIRGDDHMVNAGRQKLIYEALGWDVPVFAHVPLIFGPDGKKLSKRHGALGVMAYADMGYVPAGMRNYLTRLGWGRGDMEIFTDDDIIKVFELSDINRSPARLDFDKMAHVNAYHLHKIESDALWNMALPFLEKQNEGSLSADQIARVKPALPQLVGRAKTLVELAEQCEFLMLNRPFAITGKAKKPLKSDAEPLLRAIKEKLEAIPDSQWNEDKLSETLNTFVNDREIGFGKIGAPLRACLSAGKPSPDLALVLLFLGKTECLGRIDDCLLHHFQTQ